MSHVPPSGAALHAAQWDAGFCNSCGDRGMTMDVRNWLRPMAAALMLWAHVAFAAADNVPTAERGAQQVLERKVAEYRQVLASFDTAMAADGRPQRMRTPS